jgi:hypothetical protein
LSAPGFYFDSLLHANIVFRTINALGIKLFCIFCIGYSDFSGGTHLVANARGFECTRFRAHAVSDARDFERKRLRAHSFVTLYIILVTIPFLLNAK